MGLHYGRLSRFTGSSPAIQELEALPQISTTPPNEALITYTQRGSVAKRLDEIRIEYPYNPG